MVGHGSICTDPWPTWPIPKSDPFDPLTHDPSTHCLLWTSPAMENCVCIVQVYHFTHFCHACKSDNSSGPSGARWPGSWGPRFIEAPERAVSASLVVTLMLFRRPTRWSKLTVTSLCVWRHRVSSTATTTHCWWMPSWQLAQPMSYWSPTEMLSSLLPLYATVMRHSICWKQLARFRPLLEKCIKRQNCYIFVNVSRLCDVRIGLLQSVPALESWRPPRVSPSRWGLGLGPRPRKFLIFLHKNGVFWCTLEHGFKLNHVPARSCADN